MMAVARRRIQSAALRNVTLTTGDARVSCFRSSVFGAVFMSFILELFEEAIPNVLAQVGRVLRVGGRVGIVAMSDSGQTNAMSDLYRWLHRRWPHCIDCRPIDIVDVLQEAHFQARTAHVAEIWGLPVVAAVGIKALVNWQEGSAP
jgi:ubiquinone/menaquinone biosynthesis C-methylase UbiE